MVVCRDRGGGLWRNIEVVVCGDIGGGQGGQRWWPVGIEMVVCKDRGGGI